MSGAIEFRNVFFNYAEKAVVTAISLSIEKGQFVGIIGGNGCGKSTLMKLMNGILLPDSGEVLVEGMNTGNEEFIFEIRKKLGMVFQNPENQIIASTVEEDVVFGMENLGMSVKQMEINLQEVLDFVGLAGKRFKNPNTLSGGQKQRLAIASVLAMNPDHMVFDEPTSMLDPHGAKEVASLFLRLKEAGKTVIVSSHDMNELVNCDRIIYMENTGIVYDSKPQTVFRKLRNSEYIEITPSLMENLRIR